VHRQVNGLEDELAVGLEDEPVAGLEDALGALELGSA
jgi:hypothetical protein